MKCKIKSMYICVKDMERAVRFYEDFFEMNVSKRDEVYSVFEIDGFRFGLFSYEKMNEKHTFGSNCIPSIEVPSLKLLKNKIKNLKVVFPLSKIGKNYVAEFEDSEGNHIEITAPVQINRDKFIEGDAINNLIDDLMYNNTSALKKIINQHITLETDRLKIRPLSLKELIGINIKKYDNLRTEIEKEALITSTKNAIAKKIVKMENINERLHVWYTYWLIIDKETDKGIGFIGFKGIPDEKGYVEVGYSISPSHRRKGLMTEALRAMEKWTCSKKDCKGIIAYALKSNLGSHKVLINCGFKDSSADEYIRAYILKF